MQRDPPPPKAVDAAHGFNHISFNARNGTAVVQYVQGVGVPKRFEQLYLITPTDIHSQYAKNIQ